MKVPKPRPVKAVKAVATKAVEARDAAVEKAGEVIGGEAGPSPNPMTNLIIADLALRGGGRLLRGAVERGLLGTKYTPEKAANIVKGRTMLHTLVGTAIARVATRSVPGAIIVGGGLLAKTLYDRRKGRDRAQAKGKKAVARQANRAK